ncbi:MAG: sigma factor [Bacteroidota bacterium]
MGTQGIWNNYGNELYFFILKKVKNKNEANDIFQNTFLKIHKNLSKLKDEKKVKAWIYQIARNEIADFFYAETPQVYKSNIFKEIPDQEYQVVC